jgi:hypothetical protein
MKPDSHHQASLSALIQQPIAEIKRRVAISNYKHTEFVASEVLVTLIRTRFGSKTGVLEPAAAQLLRRVTTLIQRFIYKNPD